MWSHLYFEKVTGATDQRVGSVGPGRIQGGRGGRGGDVQNIGHGITLGSRILMS